MSDNSFPNARPNLLGDAEDSIGIVTIPAIPGLTGSLILNDSFLTDDALRGGGVVFSGNSLFVGSEDTDVRDVAVSSDGLTILYLGNVTNTIYQYDLSVANDLSTAVFSGNSLPIGSEDTSPRGLALSPDGLTLFMSGTSTDTIYQYNLSIANDLSTAVFSGNSLDVRPEDTIPEGVTISSDGLRLFMAGNSSNRIFQYNLSTANDLSTAVFSGNSLPVGSQDSFPTGVAISLDGLRLFMSGDTTNAIFQYNLSAANDLSTAVFSGRSLDVSAQDTAVRGVAISPDGFTLFMAGSQFDTIYQYDLLSPNELGFSDNYSFNSGITITTEFAQVNAGTLKVGTRVVCVVTGLVGTNLTLERNGISIVPLSPVVNPISGQPDFYSFFVDTITVEEPYTYGLRVSINPVIIGSTVLLVFPIEPDDTHQGVIDSIAIAGKQINAADSHRTHESSVLPSSEEVFSNSRPILLGDAEDSVGVIDTPAVAGLTGSLTLDDSFLTDDALRGGFAVFSGITLNTSSQDITPFGVAISLDGLRLFMLGNNSNRLFQYNLSVANDLSTAVFSGITLSVNSEDTSPRGLALSPDGLRLFILGTAGAGVATTIQYNLSTPNDLSTASFSGNELDVSPETDGPFDLAISSNGLRLFMTAVNSAIIFQYNLSVANDISTAVFSGITLDGSSEGGNMRGITISSDGLVIFAGSLSADRIFQYDLSVANDLSTAVFSGISLDISTEDDFPDGLDISSDGLTIFMAGDINATIFQYDLPSANSLGDNTVDNYSFFSDVTITTEFAQVNPGTLKVGTKVVIVVSGLVGNDLTLERNGSTIATLIPVLNPVSVQPDFFSSFVDTITVEDSYTYGLRVPSNPVTIGSTVLLVFVIQPDDTHAGIITTPAVAEKQIITADSHKTHEQSVLPD